MTNGEATNVRRAIWLVQDHWPTLIAGGCGLLAVLPIFISGIPYHYDLGNHFHLAIPFYEALRSGSVYPGWLAESNFGFGDPSVRFYPPAFYYVLSAAQAVIGSWYYSTLATIALASLCGSLAAYVWANCFVSRRFAMAAGFVYAFMPYHVAELYQSAQLAEYFAGAALLFAFAFVKKVCEQGRAYHVAGLAAALAILILGHLPLAVIGSLSLLVYGLFCTDWKRDKAALIRLVVAVALGLAASAFYWGRMVFELGWIMGDGTPPDP